MGTMAAPRQPFRDAPKADAFRQMFRPGTNFAIAASKRAGKSWLASMLSSCALDHPEYVVASNILCKKWVPDAASPDGGGWDEEYPRDYHKVRSYFDLFNVIERALRLRQIIFFVLDEAGALAKGFQKGETSLQAHVRDNAAFMAVSAHLSVCTILITQSLENIGTTFRTYEGGLLDYVITKPNMPGYSRQEVAMFESEDGRIASRHIGAYGLAHDEAWAMATPGRIVYADAVASFDRGKYPGTRIDFRLRELLDALSDQLPDKYPDIIRYHLDHAPIPWGPVAGPKAEKPQAVGSGDARDTRGALTPRIRELLEQGMTERAVVGMTGASKSMVNYVNRARKGHARPSRAKF